VWFEKDLGIVRLVMPLLRRHPWALACLMASGIMSSLAEGIGISLFVPLVQNLQTLKIAGENGSLFVCWLQHLFNQIPSQHRLTLIVACIFGSIVLKTVLGFATQALFGWLDARVTHQLRSGIFDQLLQARISFLDSFRPGQLLSSLSTETWRAGKAADMVVWAFITSGSLLIYAAILMLVSWRLTLFVTVMLLAIMSIVAFFTRRVNRMGETATRLNEDLMNQMVEALEGMKQIRAFVREAGEKSRFEHASLMVGRTYFHVGLLGNLVSPAYELISAAILVLVLLLTVKTSGNLPALLVYIFILHRLMPKIKALDACRVGLLSLEAPVKAVTALLPATHSVHPETGIQPFKGLDREITVDRVSFHYIPEKPVLQDVSLRIPAKQITALVGPSGAGKSTLVNLLFRFYDAERGSIQVDDVNLQDLDLKGWRRSIALVSQDTFLFNATVGQNIAYGRPGATSVEIMEAARLADAHGFISQMGHGYETLLGNGGIRLSGGQRQRIALARAFICDPQVLVLDEATNALDAISERLIHQTLDRFRHRKTVVVIAHRLSTIRQADQVVALENGRVSQMGPPEILITIPGVFSRLYGRENVTGKPILSL
jgi:subfamily B ATP-binding cassette protein MsbA